MARRSSPDKFLKAVFFDLPRAVFLLCRLCIVAAQAIFYTLYALYQWVIALIAVPFSLSTAYRHNQALRSLEVESLDQMSGTEFERYLIGLLRHHGYSAKHIGKAGDQGCDLLLKKDGVSIVCQAKCYTGVVTNGAVQEAVAAKAYYRATESMVVTNSYFTKSASALASANGCRLIDRDQLAALISQYRKPDNPNLLERAYERFFM